MNFKKIGIVMLAVTICILCACGHSTDRRNKDAAQAIAALQKGDFELARRAVNDVLMKDKDNHYARLVSAVVNYKDAMHQLALLVYSREYKDSDLPRLLKKSEEGLRLVDVDLEKAAHPDIELELCMACWQYDWNHNGRIDDRDQKLFEIEVDAQGAEIPEGDPRRKPTFHFDEGDVLWARAMVSFQRAVLDILLAYDLNSLFKPNQPQPSNPSIWLQIHLIEPQRIAQARARILEGQDYAEKARRLYLAETDDDREWVPNPKQKNHPLPLPVDQQLYDTWQRILQDVQKLVKGNEGLSVAEIAQLGDHKWQTPPKGFINISKMLDKPKDIIIGNEAVEHILAANHSNEENPTEAEAALKDILGEYYVPEMKPSPLLKEFIHIKSEIDRHEEPLERKLRYLLWLN